MSSLTLFQQSEVVRKQMFPTWTALKYGVLSDLFKKGEETRIGERDFRIPVETEVGGREGAYDPQMGDMGRGQPGKGAYMTGSYFSYRMAFEIDMLSIKATQDRRLAVTDPFKRLIAQGFFQFRLARDKAYHSDGTALLATATAQSGASATTYTLDTVYGAQRLRNGQYVTVYDSTLATVKSANALKINGRNTQARTVTLSGLVPGVAATDKLCFEGVSGASPTGFRGLDYWIKTDTSGTTAGVDRAVQPGIIAKSVSASGALLPELPMVLVDRIGLDRLDLANEIVGVISPVQRASVWKNIMSIQRTDIESGQAKIKDRLPTIKGQKMFQWGDVAHVVDYHQAWNVVHYIAPKLWGIAKLDIEQFFELPGSRQRFFPIAGGSGAPRAGVWFALTADEDMYTIDPGAQGIVSGLTADTLYTS